LNELIPTEFVSRIAIAHRVSAAELETLQLALQGYATADIGIELGLSGVAVRKRLGEVYKKFQIPGDGPGKLTELKHRLLERYQSHGPNRMGVDFRMSPTPIEGQVPDAPAFYGREEELARLRDWIVSDRVRLVALAGTGKIGKTALAVKLAEDLPSDFDRIIWRSLRDAPPPAEFLAEAIELLSGSPPASQTPGKQISQLIDCLGASRCLLILDDIEHLFVPGQLAGEYRQDYQDYGELLRRVGELNHRSCLVAIAQELPLEVSLMAGNGQPVRVLPLGGLSGAAGRELMAGILAGNVSQCDKIDKLAADCGGNPLLLRLAGQKAQDVFEGDLDSFIKYNEHFFGKFHKLAWMGEWLDLLFEPVFERLSPPEKALLNRAILMEETIYFSREAQSLERRSLLEKSHQNGEVKFEIDPAFRQFWVEKMMARMADFLNSPDVNQSDILRAVGFQDFEIRDNQNFLEKTVGQKIGRLFNQMGYRKFMKGEYITAKSYWSWAIAFHPQLGAAHFNLGSIYDNLQEIDLAKEHYNLAKNYQAKGKYSAASNLARLEIMAGNSEAAIASISPLLEEVEIDSIRAALLKNLGWAYLAQQRHSEAEEQLKEAIALEPSSVAAYYLLAQVKEATGDEQTALDYWRQGLHVSREKTKLKDQSWKYPEFKQWETEAKRRVEGIEETEPEEDIIAGE